MVAQTCKACKLAFYKRSRRLGLISSAGIATADTRFKSVCTKTFPRKRVLVLVHLSTLGIPQTDSIWMSKQQQKKNALTLIPCKIDTQILLRCQVTLHIIARHRRSTMTVWSRTIIPIPDLWFLVTLLLVRNDLIQLVEDDTAASLGLLRTVANFFKTLNRQIRFVKQTNIP